MNNPTVKRKKLHSRLIHNDKEYIARISKVVCS